MFNDINVTIAGNLTSEPELRYTPSGAKKAVFSVAHTPRRQDRNTQQWGDGEPTFLRCEAWQTADNVIASLHRGDRVLVIGRLRTERFTPASGGNAGREIAVVKLIVDEIGPSLRWAVATPQRPSRPDADSDITDPADPNVVVPDLDEHYDADAA